ncbi:hypothetical protein [Frankia sp. AgB32]|uniref:hypothetical protein n=1 Tax=Frankia sp. AgB32 TaxID=631119 RepID=UPI00200CB2D2|nr:hypothetical protein [Frankia sp. AgB32]MCK9896468.1 hypothetical protein [Frankia sp. AgB32]
MNADTASPDIGTTDLGTTDVLPAEIRDALARLDTLDGLPTSAHVEVFEEMNRRLAEALADLDGSAGTASPPTASPPTASRTTAPPRPGPGPGRPAR